MGKGIRGEFRGRLKAYPEHYDDGGGGGTGNDDYIVLIFTFSRDIII